MQRTIYKTTLLSIILLLCSRCADDKGEVHFGTFHSSKYFRVTVKYIGESAEIQGYPCMKGKVRFHFNDSLLSFRSAAEIRLDHGSIPAESRIYLYTNGRPEHISLSADTKIQGYGISSKKRMQGPHLSFYNGGELWKFKPQADVNINGILCDQDHDIELYPDGGLMCCHLAREIKSADHHFMSGSRILIDEAGNMHPYFNAESHLFVEKHKGKLREEHRNDNFYFNAVEGFESVLEMKPDYHAARLHLVDIYGHLPEDLGGDRQKAEGHAMELLAYDTVWAARAQALLLPEGESLLDFWLGFGKDHADDPLFQQELGRAYLKERDAGNAEACFRKAMEYENSKCTLLLDLAQYHLKQVRKDKTRTMQHSSLAEKFLWEYIDTDPVNPHKAWCYAKLAWLKDLAGDTEEGVTYLEEAERLDMRFSREETPPSLLLFIPPGDVFNEFESHFRPSSN